MSIIIPFRNLGALDDYWVLPAAANKRAELYSLGEPNDTKEKTRAARGSLIPSQSRVDDQVVR